MRKFLFLLTALCIGQTAVTAADFYLVGKGNDWSFKNEFKFSESNGVYTLHVTDKLMRSDFPAGFKISETDWNPQYGTKSGFALDEPIECVAGNGNNFYFPDDIKSITGVTFRLDLTDSSKPTLTIIPDMYLAGECNSWANTHGSYRFTNKDGVWTLALDELSGSFRIAAGVNDNEDNWPIEYGGSQGMKSGQTYDCIEGSGNNMSFADGKLTDVLLTFDRGQKKLTVGHVDTSVLDGGLYLSGDINNWHSDNNLYKFTDRGNGIYTLHVDELTGEFKVVTPDWKLELGTNSVIEFDRPLDCITGWGNNFKLPDGVDRVAGATITVDMSNIVAPKVTVSPDLYLAGEITKWDNTQKVYRFAEKEGIYTLAVSELTGKFCIAGGTQPEWPVKFGGSAGMSAGNTYDCAVNGGDMTLADGSTTDILLTFDKANRRLTVGHKTADGIGEGLYLAHQIGADWWSNHPDFRFTETQDGVYRLHVTELPSEFKLSTPEWGTQYGTEESTVFGRAMSCSEGWGGNFTIPEGVTIAGGVTVIADLRNIVSPTVTLMPDLYLAGDVTGWSNTRSEYRFSEQNGTYRLAVTDLEGEFRIVGGVNDKNGDWLLKYGGAKGISAGNGYTLVVGSDDNMTLSASNPKNVLLSFNPEWMSLEVAELAEVSTGADLYLGLDVNGDGTWWSDHPDFKFSQDNGVYTLHLDDLPDEFKVVTADWNIQLGSVSDLVFETPMTCVNGYGNNFVRPAEFETIAGVTLTVDMRGAVPTLTVMPDLYLAGELNDWHNTEAEYRFSRNGDIYTLAVPELSGNFRIAGGTAPEWPVQYGGASGMTPGNTYDCIAGKGNDMSVSSTLTNALLTFDYSTKKLTVGSITTGTVSGGLYLAGAVNGWASDNEAYRFTENNGIYTLTLERLSGEFKVVTKDWSLQFGCATPLANDKTYSCVLAANGYNMSLAEGVGTEVTITFDLDNLSVMVSGMPTLYLVGEFNNWTVSPLYAFEYYDNCYTLRTGNFSGRFQVTTADNATRLGMPVTSSLALDHVYSMAYGASDMMFGGRPDGAGRVKITIMPDGTADSTPTGIDGVAGDNDCPVEYYNLQGMRVNRPSYGIYIRRQGNKIEKVAIQ